MRLKLTILLIGPTAGAWFSTRVRFCDILRIVANPLQIAGGFEAGDHRPQIDCHRLTQRKQPDYQRRNLRLHRIQALVTLNYLNRQIAVALAQGFYGIGDGLLRIAPHFGNQSGYLGNLFGVRFNDMVLASHNGSPFPVSVTTTRTGP